MPQSLSLDSASDDPFHKRALSQQEQNEHWQREKDCCGKQQVGLIAVGANELLQPVGQWEFLFVAQIEQGTIEVVPACNELKQGDRDQRTVAAEK